MSNQPRRFSQRYGYAPVRDTVQLEQMDDALRVALWNHLSENVWGALRSAYVSDTLKRAIHFVLLKLWTNYFNRPIDEFPSVYYKVHEFIKEDFFNSEWYVPYDIIEEVFEYWPSTKGEKFIQSCNSILEKHMSGYRITSHTLASIVEKEQIDAVDEAINCEPDPVRTHLENALKLLSDKTKPDYRNSVKESVSALESKFKLILNNDKISYSKGLDQLAKKYLIHNTLKEALDRFYPYRGDMTAHGSMKLKNVEQEEAILFLITCSAFASYLTTKEARHEKNSS